MSDPLDFAPALLRVQERLPSPLGRKVLWTLLALFAATLAWALVGRLDVVAVAEGKLVPATYLKIVQPAEQGIVKEILVQEGDRVRAGQVLIRMDAALADADVKAIHAEHEHRRLALRRIDAQLSGKGFVRERNDPAGLYQQVAAQYSANVSAYESALAQERSVLDKARHDLAAAEQTRAKLAQVLPHYLEQEKAFDKLARDGYAGRILATDKSRERIEKEQDLRTQEFIIRANSALIAQSERRLAQIEADYRRQLQTERVEVANQYERARQELAKIAHRHDLLELKAPAEGTVKDLATHTAGTVAAPGTILMTLVPKDERLVAEVWIGNTDVGFVRAGQPAKIKLAPFQFQKYGMLEGRVRQVSADASEGFAYRALVELESQAIAVEGERLPIAPGMQVAAEIRLGTRTVMEYLLSPVQKAFHEAGRER